MPITHALVSAVVDDGVAGEVGPSEWNAAHSVPAHDELSGLTDDDHTQYLKEKASGGTAAETPTHAHSGASEAGTISHGDLTSVSANQHHNQAHNNTDHTTTGTPGSSTFGDAAAQGSSESVARLDHAHGREANPVTAHEAASDPHTGYRLESADHSHQSTGAQAGQLDHGAALTGLSDDDHPQYALWAAIQASQLVNEVMNFPSIEVANDTQPDWWTEADANATLTEVDVAGEGITETYARAHKLVVASANSYHYQRYTYADQQRIKSGRKLSAIFAVWSVGSVSARIRLITSAATTIVSSTTTTAGWTVLTAENITLDGTYVDIRCEVDVGTAYFVPLGINIGARAVPLPPRPQVFKALETTVMVKDLTGIGDEVTWTDVDCTASTSALAISVVIMCRMFESDAGDDFILAVRRNGSAEAFGASTNGVLRVIGGTGANVLTAYNTFEFPVDSGQIFEYYLDRNAGTGTLAAGAISVRAYREWG